MVNHTKIKYSYVFNRKKELNNEGKALIQIRAYQNCRNRYFSTGVFVMPKYWSTAKRKIKSSHPNYNLLNLTILTLRNRIEAFELQQATMNGGFSLSKLHEFSDYEKGLNSSLIEFCQSQLDGSDMKLSSRKTFQNTINKLKQFRKSIEFREVSYTFILEFDRFLRKQGLHTNTVERQHNRLKTFILEAIRQDKIKVDDNPYKKFRKHLQKAIEPERPYVTKEEIERLEALQFSGENAKLERIRDIFLMQFYTGLRHSDIARISSHNLTFSDERGISLAVTAKKTAKRLVLPLRLLFGSNDSLKSRPELLIEKYLAKDKYDTDKPLFKMTNQPYNRGLKELAQLAKIDKKMSSHSARRGFAVFLSTRVEAPVLQRLLQHSRPNMTAIYVQLSNKNIENELGKISWK